MESRSLSERAWVSVAGFDEIADPADDGVRLLDVGHVSYMVEEEHLGMLGHGGHDRGEFEWDAGVVLAIDEHDRHAGLGEERKARDAAGHAHLRSDESISRDREAALLDLADFLVKLHGAVVGEEAWHEVDNKIGAIGADGLANAATVLEMLLVVGESMRIDKAKTFDGVLVFLGIGEGDIAAQRVSHDDTIAHTGRNEYLMDTFGHKLHGEDVLVVEVGVAMPREVDEDDAVVAHQFQRNVAPNGEVLGKAMKENNRLDIAAAFVSIVDLFAGVIDNLVYFGHGVKGVWRWTACCIADISSQRLGGMRGRRGMQVTTIWRQRYNLFGFLAQKKEKFSSISHFLCQKRCPIR